MSINNRTHVCAMCKATTTIRWCQQPDAKLGMTIFGKYVAAINAMMEGLFPNKETTLT